MKNKLINSSKIVLDAKSINEGFARVAVAAFYTGVDPTVNDLVDLKTAVSEAVTNSIVHAFPSDKGRITIDLKLYEDIADTSSYVAQIKVSDRGCGIDDIKKAMEPLFTTKPQEERAGLGFAVMESFCDSIKVKSKPLQGTEVTLIKKLTSK